MIKQEEKATYKEKMSMLNQGGHTVKAGTYWNMSNGSRVQMDQEGALSGQRADSLHQGAGCGNADGRPGHRLGLRGVPSLHRDRYDPEPSRPKSW